MTELQIDKELEGLFPPLSEEEFNQLEENIVKEGCLEKLITWNGTLVDGHNRYKICRKHNLPFETIDKEFEDKDQAIVWMIDHQTGRRNLTTPDKIEIALTRESSIKAMAKKRQEGGQGGKLLLDHGPKANEPIHTNDEIGKYADVSGKTVSRYKTIKNDGDPEVYEKVRKGEMSIRAGYDTIRPPKPKPEPKSDEKKELEQIRSIKEYAAHLKRPVSNVSDAMKCTDPIVEDLTIRVKSFIGEISEYQFIGEKVSPELNKLIVVAMEKLNNIKSKIKEK